MRIEEMQEALVPEARRVLRRRSLSVCPLKSSPQTVYRQPWIPARWFYSSSFLDVLILVTSTAFLVDLVWFLGSLFPDSFLGSCFHIILQLNPGYKPNSC